MKKNIPQYAKNIFHLFQAIFANIWFGFPSRKIKVIGITGTNGKTTTTQMIGRILEESGKKVAISSTINFKIGKKEWVNKTKFTTLSSFATQKFIAQAIKSNCQYVVLETSSHALDQNRVWGIFYDTAVITNVTREHLDYHKNMEYYRFSKQKIFLNAKNAVVNLDMKNWRDFWDLPVKNKFGFTTNEQKKIDSKKNENLIVAKEIILEDNASSFSVNGKKFFLKIPGIFNIENALAAIGVAMLQKINLQKISLALKGIEGIAGRLERVKNDKNLDIIIDYAVTPDSLEKLYALIKKIKLKKISEGYLEAKIIAVFGSCGERDRGKRPIMGQIVSQNADYILVTNEDPYGENPTQIINEVFGGVVGKEIAGELPQYKKEENIKTSKNKKIEGVNCWRIFDRREAIKKALNLACTGDIIIVSGKGAEETMAIGKKRIEWNDKKTILEELKKM